MTDNFFLISSEKNEFEQAQAQIIRYYEEKATHNAQCKITSDCFINLLKKHGLKTIYLERYNEEFGSGRGESDGKKGIPLLLSENDRHCLLLLDPEIYLEKIKKRLPQYNMNDLLVAVAKVGPICAMATIREINIGDLKHNKNGVSWLALKKYLTNHWQRKPFFSSNREKIFQAKAEKIKISRMQVPQKPLNDTQYLNYSYRHMGFCRSIVKNIIEAVKKLYPEEEYLYLHARAGKLEGIKKNLVDEHWLVPLYLHLGGIWSFTADNYLAFCEDPYLNMVIKLPLGK